MVGHVSLLVERRCCGIVEALNNADNFNEMHRMLVFHLIFDVFFHEICIFDDFTVLTDVDFVIDMGLKMYILGYRGFAPSSWERALYSCWLDYRLRNL